MNLNYREDGRIEWVCKHGIGHTVYYPEWSDGVHGCDRCCCLKEFRKLKFLVCHILILEGKIEDNEYIMKYKEYIKEDV